MGKSDSMRVYYYICNKKGKNGKAYIYLVEVVCENGRCRQENIANVEALYKIAKWFKNRGLRLDKRTVKKY